MKDFTWHGRIIEQINSLFSSFVLGLEFLGVDQKVNQTWHANLQRRGIRNEVLRHGTIYFTRGIRTSPKFNIICGRLESQFSFLIWRNSILSLCSWGWPKSQPHITYQDATWSNEKEVSRHGTDCFSKGIRTSCQLNMICGIAIQGIWGDQTTTIIEEINTSTAMVVL